MCNKFHQAKMSILVKTARSLGYEAVISFHCVAVLMNGYWRIFDSMSEFRQAHKNG